MTHEHIILYPKSGDPREVELYVAGPAGNGPWPAILYVHGHQTAERTGAHIFVEFGRLARRAKHGFVAAAVSMPGYGSTTGPPDFSGPRTQAAVEEGLTYLRHLPSVDLNRIVLYGVSRGAMAATRDRNLQALILVAGLYDLGESYPTGDRGVDRNIERETGATPDSFADRSALRHAEKITAATLILHGEQDVRGASVDQARRLTAALQANGILVRERIFPGVGHHVPPLLQSEEILPFLENALKPH